MALRAPAVAYSPTFERAHGFSLMELMVVVAIVGVMATLVVPGMYVSYVRGQIVDSAPIVDVAKKQVSAYWSASGDLPANNAEAGLPAPDKMVSNYVKSVTVTDGVIDVVFGNNVHALIKDKVLTFRPAVVNDSPIVPVAWVCAATAVPAKMSVRGQDRTSVPTNVLPVNCR